MGSVCIKGEILDAQKISDEKKSVAQTLLIVAFDDLPT
jgi:hypothetical protein